MPLPSFWKSSNLKSEELGLENLITGIFLHEFSHSQQMRNFGEKITFLENEINLDFEYSDNIIQDLFSKDNNYVKLYNQEVEKFFQTAKNTPIDVL